MPKGMAYKKTIIIMVLTQESTSSTSTDAHAAGPSTNNFGPQVPAEQLNAARVLLANHVQTVSAIPHTAWTLVVHKTVNNGVGKVKRVAKLNGKDKLYVQWSGDKFVPSFIKKQVERAVT
jgi:hypothetical protein